MKNNSKNKIKIELDCLGCGECCRIEGYVHLNKNEIKEIAAYMKMDEVDFKIEHVRYVAGEGRVLKDNLKGACKFLKNNKCKIYSVRPSQCRDFPHWKELKTKSKDLKEAMRYCSGIKLR